MRRNHNAFATAARLAVVAAFVGTGTSFASAAAPGAAGAPVDPPSSDPHPPRAAADVAPGGFDRLTLSGPASFPYVADAYAAPATAPSTQGTDFGKQAGPAGPAGPAGQADRGPGLYKGVWDLELFGSHMSPIRHTHDYVNAGGAAVGYFVADGFSLNAAVVGYAIDQPDNDAVAGGFDLYARWYFLGLGRFAAYADGGAGVVIADKAVPEWGTHFNFTPRGGAGLSYRLGDNLYLMGGVRYWHLSNAGIHGISRNPSYDSVQYYGSVMFTF